MQQKAVLHGIIGLLSGVLLTILFTSNVVNSNNTGMMQMMGINTNRSQLVVEDKNLTTKGHMMPDGSMMMDEEMGSSRSMNGMVSSLKGKTGDEFDKAFLSGMIEHHQGAIDMANLAKQYAGHQEIKSMAEDIITAQAKEIEQMRRWYKEWGY